MSNGLGQEQIFGCENLGKEMREIKEWGFTPLDNCGWLLVSSSSSAAYFSGAETENDGFDLACGTVISDVPFVKTRKCSVMGRQIGER